MIPTDMFYEQCANNSVESAHQPSEGNTPQQDEGSMKIVSSASSLFRGQIQGSNPEKLKQMVENQLKVAQKTYRVNNELILSQFASQTQHQSLMNMVIDQLVETNTTQCEKLNQLVTDSAALMNEFKTLPQKAKEARQLLQYIAKLEEKVNSKLQKK